jgi:hypothetical protein
MLRASIDIQNLRRVAGARSNPATHHLQFVALRHPGTQVREVAPPSPGHQSMKSESDGDGSDEEHL